MNNKTTYTKNINNLKKFINTFFVQPSWSDLPSGFPNCNLNGLTKEEERLFDGIVLSWKVNTKKGRMTIYKDIVTKTCISIAIVFGVFAANQLNFQNNESIATPVSAATVSATIRSLGNGIGSINVGKAVESTFSGMLKDK